VPITPLIRSLAAEPETLSTFVVRLYSRTEPAPESSEPEYVCVPAAAAVRKESISESVVALNSA